MIKMSKMSKILNGLRDYDQVRNEDEEDQQRTLLFEHLAEATDSYNYGCDMLLLSPSAAGLWNGGLLISSDVCQSG